MMLRLLRLDKKGYAFISMKFDNKKWFYEIMPNSSDSIIDTKKDLHSSIATCLRLNLEHFVNSYKENFKGSDVYSKLEADSVKKLQDANRYFTENKTELLKLCKQVVKAQGVMKTLVDSLSGYEEHEEYETMLYLLQDFAGRIDTYLEVE